MADVFSVEKRSEVMKLIHGRDTRPEIIVRRFLFSKGMRFRLHQKTLIGKPDIVLKKYKAIIFVNGCFWHGHRNCKYSKIPGTNQEFWADKIQKNFKRDHTNKMVLEANGWKVITIWECKLSPKKCDETLINLYKNVLS